MHHATASRITPVRITPSVILGTRRAALLDSVSASLGTSRQDAALLGSFRQTWKLGPARRDREPDITP